MAIRGITGALMAGPMEQTKLIEFPYEAMRQRNLDLEASRIQGMENTLGFQQSMDALGGIPGTKEITSELTQPYQDKLSEIYKSTGGDPGKAAPMIQNLMFDYQFNKSKEIKEREKAVAGYQALQTQLNNPESNVDPRTASAFLNNSVQDYLTQQQAYEAGEGPVPSSTAFSGMPIATPDVEKTLLAIQDKIKPDQYSNYGYQPVMAEDANGNKYHTGEYVKGTETTKYSSADVRSALTSHFLKQIPEYQNYATQQYDLGLTGQGKYNKEVHGGLMDIEATINPLLQPLSEDPNEKAWQIKNQGVNTEAEYLQLQSVERANKEALFSQQVQKVAEQNGITPEEAEEYLASNAFGRLETEGVLDEMGSASAIGAFQQQTLSDIDSDGGSIDYETFPYPKDNVYTTDQIQTGGTPYTDGDKITQSLTDAQSRQAEIQNILSSNLVSDEEKARVSEELGALETDIVNLQKNEIPFKVMDIMKRFEKDNTKYNYNDVAYTVTEEDLTTPKKLDAHRAKIATTLADFYDLTKIYGDGEGNIDTDAFNKDLSDFMNLSEFDWNNIKNDPNNRTLTARGTDGKQIAYMVDDLRDKMARFERVDEVERTVDYVVPGKEVTGGIEKNSPERARVDDRAEALMTDKIRVTDPLNGNVLIGDVNSADYANVWSYMNNTFSTEAQPAQWAPQIYSAGWFEGKEAFIMDMGYYIKGGETHAMSPDQLADADHFFISDKLQYDNVSFTEERRRLVHISNGPREYNDLKFQRESEISSLLAARNIDGAQRSAVTATQMELNQQFMPALQGSKIESLRPIDFDEMGQGFVSQALDAGIFERRVDKETGKVVYDPAMHSLKVEKITQPDGSEMYQLYSLPYKGTERNVKDEANRDYFTSNGQQQWGNLEDLIFSINGGGTIAQQKIANAQRGLTQ